MGEGWGGDTRSSASSGLKKSVSGVLVFVEVVDKACFSEEYTIFSRKVSARA